MKYGHAGTVRTESDRLRNRTFKFECAVLLVIALIPLILLNGCAGFASSTGKQAAQALFQLNPTAINFGKVSVGKTTTQTVSVCNDVTVPTISSKDTFS